MRHCGCWSGGVVAASAATVAFSVASAVAGAPSFFDALRHDATARSDATTKQLIAPRATPGPHRGDGLLDALMGISISFATHDGCAQLQVDQWVRRRIRETMYEDVMRRSGERELRDTNELTVAHFDNHNSLVTDRRHQATLSPSLRSIHREVV